MPIPDFYRDERADNIELEGVTPVSEINPFQTTPIPQEQVVDPVQETEPVLQSAAVDPLVEKQQPYLESQDLASLLNTKAPRPEYDEGREKRLETMASAKGVAQALGTLGDAFSLSKSGVVPKRNIKAASPELAQILQDKKDHKERMEAADFADYTNQLRTGVSIAGAKGREARAEEARSYRDEATKKEETRYQEGRSYRDEATKKEETRYQEGLERDKAESDSEFANRKELANLNAELRGDLAKKEHGYNMDEITARYKAAADAALVKEKNKVGEDSYKLHSKDGKRVVQINDEGELQKMYSLIISDDSPELTKNVNDMMALLEPSLGEPGNKAQQEVIVSRFWEISPNAQKYLQGRDGGAATPSAASANKITYESPDGTPYMIEPKDEAEFIKKNPTYKKKGGEIEETTPEAQDTKTPPDTNLPSFFGGSGDSANKTAKKPTRFSPKSQQKGKVVQQEVIEEEENPIINRVDEAIKSKGTKDPINKRINDILPDKGSIMDFRPIKIARALADEQGITDSDEIAEFIQENKGAIKEYLKTADIEREDASEKEAKTTEAARIKESERYYKEKKKIRKLIEQGTDPKLAKAIVEKERSPNNIAELNLQDGTK